MRGRPTAPDRSRLLLLTAYRSPIKAYTSDTIQGVNLSQAGWAKRAWSSSGDVESMYQAAAPATGSRLTSSSAPQRWVTGLERSVLSSPSRRRMGKAACLPRNRAVPCSSVPASHPLYHDCPVH